MRRGTTPTHIFTVPLDLIDMMEKVEIAYAQDGNTILIKTASDCQIVDNTITIKLTQEDTFLFRHNKDVEIQVRILTKDGNALSSDIIVVSVKRCLSNEVLQ